VTGIDTVSMIEKLRYGDDAIRWDRNIDSSWTQDEYKQQIQDLFLYHLGNSDEHTGRFTRHDVLGDRLKSALIKGLLAQNHYHISLFATADFDIELEQSEYWPLHMFNQCVDLGNGEEPKRGTRHRAQKGCEMLSGTEFFGPGGLEEFSIFHHNETSSTLQGRRHGAHVLYTWGISAFELRDSGTVLYYVGPINQWSLDHDYTRVYGSSVELKGTYLIQAYVDTQELNPNYSVDEAPIEWYTDFDLYLDTGLGGPYVQGYLQNHAQQIIIELTEGELHYWRSGNWKRDIPVEQLDFWNWDHPPVVHNPTGPLKDLMDLLVSLKFYEVT
jgi:hypothetical protein